MIGGRVAVVTFAALTPDNIRISFRKANHEERKNTKMPSRTDWKRIDAMRDEDIDYSDIPKLGPDFFKNAILWPGPKKQITLRIGPDVLTFFASMAAATRRR